MNILCTPPDERTRLLVIQMILLYYQSVLLNLKLSIFSTSSHTTLLELKRCIENKRESTSGYISTTRVLVCMKVQTKRN